MPRLPAGWTEQRKGQKGVRDLCMPTLARAGAPVNWPSILRIGQINARRKHGTINPPPLRRYHNVALMASLCLYKPREPPKLASCNE